MNLLRADEVAYALNKNPNQVYRLAHYHGWQKVQLGKHVYYWKTDVESYVERGLDV